MKKKIESNLNWTAILWLVLLLTIIGHADQIQAQTPNPLDTKKSARKDEKVKTKSTAAEQIDVQKETLLHKRKVASELKSDDTNGDKSKASPMVEKVNQKKPKSESNEDQVTDELNNFQNKKLKIIINEDTVEYQDFKPVRRAEKNAMVEEIEIPVRSAQVILPIEIMENTRQASLPLQDRSPVQTILPVCDLNRNQEVGEPRDPFVKISAECQVILRWRDPFSKPVVIETDAANNFGGGVSNLISSYANYRNSAAIIRRSNAGFNPAWIDWILSYSYRENVDPLLLLEVMRWESSFNPNALSPAGAGGLMQFMPGTAARFNINPFNEQQAIMGGAKYLGFLLRKFNGNVLSALAGYNAGEGAVDAFLRCRPVRAGRKTINPGGRCMPHGIPPYAETQKYAHGIWANYQMSLKRSAEVSDLRRRLTVNVRFKFSGAVEQKGLTE